MCKETFQIYCSFRALAYEALDTPQSVFLYNICIICILYYKTFYY